MSSNPLADNPYAEEASRCAAEATLLNEWSEVERAILAQLATAQATLALATEQRTTALVIAATAVDGTGVYSLAPWLVDAAQDQLAERLGIPAPDAGLDPARNPPPAEDLEHAIEQLATDLWEADTAKSTPARTFSEDYANAQDRYRTMARAILAPEPVEPAAKR